MNSLLIFNVIQNTNTKGVLTNICTILSNKSLSLTHQRINFMYILIIALLLVIVFILIYKLRIRKVKAQRENLKQEIHKRIIELEKRNEEISKHNSEIKEQRDLANKQKQQIINQNSELEMHRNHLEKLIEERTKELLEAKETAELAEKLKSAFLENMSHEIRTPMNALLGFLDLLDTTGIKEVDKKEYMYLIHSSAKTLLSIIDDLIELSKIESGSIQLNNNWVNLNLIIDELSQIYKIRLKAKDSELKIEITKPERDVEIFTDELRLKQILIHLIENAIKFTKQGNIYLGYKIVDNYAVFSVKDEGIGIDKKNLSIIFDRFSKVEEGKIKLYSGTGLGLAICKQLVEKMNGRIWLESELNVGSMFYFTLPLNSSEKEIKIPTREIDLSNINFEGFTILIAEDEESNFNYLNSLLKQYKPNIIRANDGKEAVDLFKNNKVDLVLMDIKMPKLNGLEATKAIKAFNKDIPVIAQTAYAMAEDRTASMESGCDDFVSKPIERSELLSKMLKYIKK